MSPWWILLPLAIAFTSLWLVDGPRWRRPVGVVMLLAGLAGVLGVVLFNTFEAQEGAGRCASLGGVPVNGGCWIDGERQ